MSDFQAVMNRSLTDYDFYLGVLHDPTSTLAEYDLDDEERRAFAGRRAGLRNSVPWLPPVENPPPPPPGLFVGPIGPVAPPDPAPPGIVARIPLNFLTAVEGVAALSADGIVGDVAVVDAVRRIRAAADPTERNNAVSQLMERIG